MIETELIGEINSSTFKEKLSEFTEKFGDPIKKNRISLMFNHTPGSLVDTRIRITNGVSEIMQKLTLIKEINGLRSKEEIQVKLNTDVEDIMNLASTFSNLVNGKEAVRLVVQLESYTWDNEDYELKIVYQFGKNDYYLYEIESKKESLDLFKIQKELALVNSADFSSEERKRFRREEVDLKIDDLNQEELRNLVLKYLS